MSRYFQSDNRYRDTAVSPDGRTLYIATDPDGQAEAMAGGTTRNMQDRGAILVFTYSREGTGTPVSAAPPKPAAAPKPVLGKAKQAGPGPQFTAAQVTRGRTAYDESCAVCHGNTLTNGTFGPTLVGDSFKAIWSGQTVRALYDKARTMPPGAPESLAAADYAAIVAYVLSTNGAAAGRAALPAGGAPLDGMVIP